MRADQYDGADPRAEINIVEIYGDKFVSLEDHLKVLEELLEARKSLGANQSQRLFNKG